MGRGKTMAQTQRRRNFSVEFKRKAVADARMLVIRAAGRKHGVSQVSVLKWLKSAEEAGKEMAKTGQSVHTAAERLRGHRPWPHTFGLPTPTRSRPKRRICKQRRRRRRAAQSRRSDRCQW